MVSASTPVSTMPSLCEVDLFIGGLVRSSNPENRSPVRKSPAATASTPEQKGKTKADFFREEQSP